MNYGIDWNQIGKIKIYLLFIKAKTCILRILEVGIKNMEILEELYILQYDISLVLKRFRFQRTINTQKPMGRLWEPKVILRPYK